MPAFDPFDFKNVEVRAVDSHSVFPPRCKDSREFMSGSAIIHCRIEAADPSLKERWHRRGTLIVTKGIRVIGARGDPISML
jgi:hypothetical protein